MAKLFGSDTAMRVTTDAVQIHGGYGYMQEYPVERYMREAKALQIVEGTNQVERMVIVRRIGGGGYPPRSCSLPPRMIAGKPARLRRSLTSTLGGLRDRELSWVHMPAELSHAGW